MRVQLQSRKQQCNIPNGMRDRSVSPDHGAVITEKVGFARKGHDGADTEKKSQVSSLSSLGSYYSLDRNFLLHKDVSSHPNDAGHVTLRELYLVRRSVVVQ
jgi:hypothetical protein